MSDDVCVTMLGKMEADRETARARILRIVVGNGRDAREVREAHGHWSGIPLDMRRARKSCGLGRRPKHAVQQEAFRVSRSETWMNTTISFVESLDDVTAKGQHFFVRSQRHGLNPSVNGFRLSHYCTRESRSLSCVID